MTQIIVPISRTSRTCSVLSVMASRSKAKRLNELINLYKMAWKESVKICRD